jgi:hypothetical protein
MVIPPPGYRCWSSNAVVFWRVSDGGRAAARGADAVTGNYNKNRQKLVEGVFILCNPQCVGSTPTPQAADSASLGAPVRKQPDYIGCAILPAVGISESLCHTREGVRIHPRWPVLPFRHLGTEPHYTIVTAGLDRTLAHDTYLVASDFILILYRFPVFWRVAEFTEFTLGIGHPAGFSRSGLLQDY